MAACPQPRMRTAGWELLVLEEQGPLANSAESLAATVNPALCPQEHRGLLSIRYPMEHGIVKDWNDMERIWQYVYSKDQLQTFSEEVRVPCTGQPCGVWGAGESPAREMRMVTITTRRV